MKWFNDGDRNTHFFNNYVKGHRKRLAIHEITITQGDVINKTVNIGPRQFASLKNSLLKQDKQNKMA